MPPKLSWDNIKVWLVIALITTSISLLTSAIASSVKKVDNAASESYVDDEVTKVNKYVDTENTKQDIEILKNEAQILINSDRINKNTLNWTETKTRQEYLIKMTERLLDDFDIKRNDLKKR